MLSGREEVAVSTHKALKFPSERAPKMSGHREAHMAESRGGEGMRGICKAFYKEPLGVTRRP